MKAPTFSPGLGGGMNPGMGGFGEHLDENVLQQAMKQQSSQTSGTTAAAPAHAGANTVPSSNENQSQAPVEPTSVFEAVVERPMEDIGGTLVEVLHLDGLLGLIHGADTPEEKMKRQQTHQRYEQLEQGQQAVARANYQERLQREEMLRQEKKQRDQMEAQKHQDFVMPSSPKKGPDAGGGSQKQRATTKLEQDRKTLNGPQSAG